MARIAYKRRCATRDTSAKSIVLCIQVVAIDSGIDNHGQFLNMEHKKVLQKSILQFIEVEKKNINNTPDFVKAKIESQLEKVSKIREQNENVAEIQNINKISELEAQLDIERKKNEKLTNDLKKTVAVIKNASEVNLKKDFQIDILTKKLQVACIDEKKDTKVVQLLFTEFEKILSNEQLNKLRSISSGKPKDSTFVLKCVDFLYPDHSVLENVTATGKMRNNQKKQVMCSTNVDLIKRMLNQRIYSEEGIDDVSASQRLNALKLHIKNAITTLRRRCKQANKRFNSVKKEYTNLAPVLNYEAYTVAEPQPMYIFYAPQPQSEL